MGFLNRKKKQPESDEYKKIKTTEEIINEQQETESQNLQTQINEKATHLASITEKLELIVPPTVLRIFFTGFS